MPPSLLEPIGGPAPEDEAAFLDYAADLIRQFGLLMSLFMAAATLLWWPLDLVVQSSSEHIAAFARLRGSAITIEVVAAVGFLSLRRSSYGLCLAWGVLAYSALLASFGLNLGRLGQLDLLADAYLGAVPLALVPVSLRMRVPMTLFVTGVLPAAYFLPWSGNIDAPGAWSQLSFLAFAVLLTTALGEIWHRTLRRAFFQQRALDGANSALAQLTDSLSAQVAEKTKALRGLARHLEQVQEAERRRIARDLHDDLGQELTAIRYTLARVERRIGDGDEELMELLSDLGALTEGTTDTVRSFITELRPRILDDLGLLAASEWLCERTRRVGGVQCALDIDADFPREVDEMDAETALVLFRVLQEGTTNALKHAAATSVRLGLRRHEGGWAVEVEDDGRGFDPSAETEGFGLLGLEERLRGLDGQLGVTSEPGRGTRIVASLPARPAAMQERSA